MARSTFGGTANDYVFTATSGGLLRLAPATLTFWSEEVGGSRYTDLLLDGTPTDQIAVGSHGQIPVFEGPDGVLAMWVDGGGGRTRLVAEGRPGPQGEQGPQGVAGGSDAETAERVRNGPQTKAALSASIDRTTPQRVFTGRNLNLASRVSTPFDVLFLGDSLFQGQAQAGVSSRWPNRTIQRLRSRLPVPGVAGGVGYFPAVWTHATPANPWTFTGNTATSNTRGLGRLGRTLGATTGSGAGSGSMSFTGTGITLVWYAPGADTASVVIDGGAPATFTGGGTPAHGLKLWSSPTLTSGAHTITVTHASGNPIVLQGGIVYDGDENKGIRAWEGAQSGSRARDFNGTETTNGHLWVENIGFTVVPDLIVVDWMANDATSQTAAQYQTSLGLVRDLIRTKSNAPILWVAPWERSAALIEPWANYVAAMRAVAAADTGASDFFNIGDYVPKLNPDPFGALADGTHPTDKFAAYLGELLAGHILGPWAAAA